MVTRNDDRFQPRPGAPKARSGPRSQRFISQVLKASSKSGATGSGSRPASTFGRGRVASVRAGQGLAPNARRAIIKARYVVLKSAGAKAVETHLRYIERDGTTRDGQRGQAYGPDTDAANLQAFEQRGRGDRHQFRFIVSVEDSPELEDLKGFTRQLMQRVQTDLETGLDWVAVDHWDTDNPHTHIVLRGRAKDGQNLVIAPDYMAHGMRMRANELATEWLGPRTELEMRQTLQREVDQERLTSLDRTLIRQATDLTVDLTSQPTGQQRQTLLRARLQRLEALSLAKRLTTNQWQLSPVVEKTLVAMGARGDILHTLHRAMRGEHRELVTNPQANHLVIGRIAAKGMDEELYDRPYLVIDGIDGRAYYLKLPVGTDLSELPIGGIVEARPLAQERAVDRNILAAASGGIYTTASHQAQLALANDRDSRATVEAHVRRLEALRRSHIVERVADGVWTVPQDLMKKARQHDEQKSSGLTIELRSHLAIEQQVKAMGGTWLDRCLLVDDTTGKHPAHQGFGAQVRSAMSKRVDFLTEQGVAERRGQRVILARSLLATLRDLELGAVGQDLQTLTGKTWCPVQDGQPVSGVYSQSIQLVSGRFAMLDNGPGFSLVAWKPVIEQRMGQQLSAIVHGLSPTWTLGIQRGASR